MSPYYQNSIVLTKTNFQKGMEILTTMIHKIPVFVLSIHLAIVSEVYDVCNNSSEQKTLFWVYYPFMCVLCFLWEFLYIYLHIGSKISYVGHKNICYSLTNAFISLFSYISTSYYMQDGKPFSCVFDYDKNIATVFFYLSYAIIFTVSTFEKKFIKCIK